MKEEGFVRHEYNVRLAQPDEGCKKAEEINLVRKIESRIKNLMQSLNSIEAMTNGLNKNLLPIEPKAESEAKADQRPPQGWLECHLADLEFTFNQCGQIYDQVTRLMQATKTEAK